MLQISIVSSLDTSHVNTVLNWILRKLKKTMNTVKIFVLMLAYIIGVVQTHPQTCSQLIDILRHHTDQGNLLKHIDNKTVKVRRLNTLFGYVLF